MTAVRFHEAAIAEIVHETLYYRTVSLALAVRFTTALEQATHLAAEFPEMGTTYLHGTRRVFLRKFPFSLIYLGREGDINVLALAHQTRKPAYWLARSRPA